ncbi:hypothetical protein OHB41_07865 [Streptomyces sp. NBC_01571]|uniref:DUF6907 domain-containing protein n=1 Tax=Streptomyces sp. NBC_01571 TaxID=2975883 RepID=UPI0022584C4A|nr:hypothetical protein [Streptomyces sp. NBC_01571]MCX4573102.1 hypothetical protein [Streptomyces sp. NBC_01571]
MANHAIAQHAAALAGIPTQKPAAESDRTVTYRLRSGGFLAHACPAWCTFDHSDEAEVGLTSPEDLQHMGDAINLGFDVDGGRDTILEARLVQWPFAPEGDSAPHIDFVPEASTGESMICRSRLELNDQIRRVRAHLGALVRLGDRLSDAQAADHATNTQFAHEPWLSLGSDELATLPIAYLLKVFGITVVETEDTGRRAVLALYGEPGAMEVRVYPDVSQQLREDETRRALLAWHDAREGGVR